MTIKWIVGVLNRDNHIVITKLRQKNVLMPRMEWFFPFVQLNEDESPRIAIKRFLKKELGMDISVGQMFLKYTPSENPNVEQYFYEITPKNHNVVLGKEFSNYSWIKPEQVLKYFTTTISAELMDYLRSLDEPKKGIILR